MGHRVGLNGQIVIEKPIRDALGVEPGWIALQQLVDDHVEIYFIPSEHDESLVGVLAPYITVSVSEADYSGARERAWQEHVRERFGDKGKL